MKSILAIFVLCFSSLHAAVIEDRCTLKVETPSLQQREVRKLRLENGLEALLISDPEASQSGAALAVNVGSFDDPVERPGMAHFVEHLLFLGTEKYPEEEGYSRYLDEHGGQRNAFTMNDRTVYFFSVNHGGFAEALDRFGHFFIDPLFTPSGVNRECHAIHQEYCKNLPLDACRLLYVYKELCTPEHPFHNFCMGNLETLAKISQDELKEWYHLHYGAQLMHLVIVSTQSLDHLEKQVEELFAHVKSSSFAPTAALPPLLTAAGRGQLAAIAPIQQLQHLELMWEIPSQNLDVRADHILSHLIGHEAQGSLLALLKQHQLADCLSVGSHHIGKQQTLFTIDIQLTDRGLQEYEQVIAYCFQALASYRITGIPRLLFDEVAQLDRLRYCYQSRSPTATFVSDYAEAMIDEPLETFPEKTLTSTRYERESFDGLLAKLTPDSCHFSLLATPQKSRLLPDLKERWLGADYTIHPLSTHKLQTWTASLPHPLIHLPEKNAYFPQNLTLVEATTDTTPLLLEDSEQGTCYFCIDQDFKVPQISWNFSLKTPLISTKQIKSHVLADLFCHTVSERLKGASYEAALGGLSFDLIPDFNGLRLRVDGFHDKAPLLMEHIVNALATTVPTKGEFEEYRALLQRHYSNTCSRSPLAEAKELVWSLLYEHFPSANQKLKILNTLSYEEMKSFSRGLWKKGYVEALLYGNVSQTTAQEVWHLVKSRFCHHIYPTAQHFKPALATLHNVHLLEHSSPLPGNAVILVADFGDFSFKTCAAMDILCTGLEEPFFSELRTKQQTAYLIRHWNENRENHLYALFAVQSTSHDTRDLLARFELFLESSLRHLDSEVIPKARFESIRTAIVEQLHHPAENVEEMGHLLYDCAFIYRSDFAWIENRIAALEALTYEEFLTSAHHYLGTTQPKRLAVCVNGIVPCETGVHYQPTPSSSHLRSLLDYSHSPPFQN